MLQEDQKKLSKMLEDVAIELQGSMDSDNFKDYILSFVFLRYLSNNYDDQTIKDFWGNICKMAYTSDQELLNGLKSAFKHMEEQSFKNSLKGLFSEINLDSDKLGKDYKSRNDKLCAIISKISRALIPFCTGKDTLGDVYEHLIRQFAGRSGKGAGEFYTPQEVSSILSGIVALDTENPEGDKKTRLENVLDMTCGSGSLLLNLKNHFGEGNIGKIYGQEKNITTYNLARMNMILHGLEDSQFEIYHGDTLENEWDILNQQDPDKKQYFDAIVANPPFSLKWSPDAAKARDPRFKDYGLAPNNSADFALLLHGFHYLKESGTMAVILPHGVLFRGNSEEKIRTKLLKNGYIDAVIGLPSYLFYSTAIPVCILVLKKRRKFKDVLFINASENFEKGRPQNHLRKDHIDKIISTYQLRKEEDYYSKRVSIEAIAKKHDYNLNISRYVNVIKPEKQIDIHEVHLKLCDVEEKIKDSTKKHNEFLKELGLDLLIE